MTHELKILPQYYCRVADGSKTFEMRVNDRGFQSGDTVILQEWSDKPLNETTLEPLGYTGAPDLTFKIGYILVLNSTEVVFSLLDARKAKEKATRGKVRK